MEYQREDWELGHPDLPLTPQNRKRAKNKRTNKQEHSSHINVTDQTILLRQPCSNYTA